MMVTLSYSEAAEEQNMNSRKTPLSSVYINMHPMKKRAFPLL